LPLALGLSAPASALTVDGTNSSSASPYVINSTITETVWVSAGGFLNIVSGADISTSVPLVVDGGTVNVTGGTLSGSDTGVEFTPNGGTLNVSSGTISGGSAGNALGVLVSAGTANLSGGTISGGSYGVAIHTGTVNLSGSAISASSQGIEVQGGTLNVSAGTVSGDTGVVVQAVFSSVAVNVSGGAIMGGSYGFRIASGPVSISGGSISGGVYGVALSGGALSIFGCGLQLSAAGQLTGTLQDRTPINTNTSGLGPGNLMSTCPATYAWSGVLQPVNADGSSVFKLGSTVPVKFALTGDSASITTLQATLFVAKISNSIVGTDGEAVSTSAATTGNLFRYDPTSGLYVFNWSTKGLSSGTYQLRIDLGDGVLHTVILGLK
jgi:hypothetical protein